jgi:hypothetical protein
MAPRPLPAPRQPIVTHRSVPQVQVRAGPWQMRWGQAGSWMFLWWGGKARLNSSSSIAACPNRSANSARLEVKALQGTTASASRVQRPPSTG